MQGKAKCVTFKVYGGMLRRAEFSIYRGVSTSIWCSVRDRLLIFDVEDRLQVISSAVQYAYEKRMHRAR